MKLRADLPTIVSVTSILGFLFAMWYKVGWVSPELHDEDIHNTTQAVVEFQTRWLCDEDQEELEELLKQPTRTAAEVQRVAELADNIDELDCRKYRN